MNRENNETRPELSVISTLYRSRPFLERFLSECLQALSELKFDHFEILLVNDGSPDDSLAYALERQQDIPQLVIVDLSRNFGHHHAIQAGLRNAAGELIFLIDCDLEVSPRVLRSLSQASESDCDMVFGYQEARKAALIEQAGRVFWKGFNLLSDIKIPENIVTERIMTRRYRRIAQMGPNLFLAGMMSWTGYRQITCPLSRSSVTGSIIRSPGELASWSACRLFSAQP
jgi:putative glycosyltransferase